MSQKITTISIENYVRTGKKMSVFNKIVSEIDASNIPTKFIDHLYIQYYDGTIVCLQNKELTYPIPVNDVIDWDNIGNAFSSIKSVRININVEKLEAYVNEIIEQYVGKFC